MHRRRPPVYERLCLLARRVSTADLRAAQLVVRTTGSPIAAAPQAARWRWRCHCSRAQSIAPGAELEHDPARDAADAGAEFENQGYAARNSLSRIVALFPTWTRDPRASHAMCKNGGRAPVTHDRPGVDGFAGLTWASPAIRPDPLPTAP